MQNRLHLRALLDRRPAEECRDDADALQEFLTTADAFWVPPIERASEITGHYTRTMDSYRQQFENDIVSLVETLHVRDVHDREW